MVQKRVHLRRVRKSAGFTQEDLAHRLGMHVASVQRWEAGETEPAAWMQPRVAKLLGVTRAELVRLLEPEPAEATPRSELHEEEHQQLAAVFRDTQAGADQSLVVSILGPSRTLALLDELVSSLISRYEVEGPQQLAPEARALRRLTYGLSRQVSGVAERMKLVEVSARQAALLAYMSVNLSRFADADTYALEAAMLATAANDRPLLAWIKGTQSFNAYYQERYADALNLAQVGLQLAQNDRQRIRLLSNGVARAAGKLGDRATVDQAVTEAFELVAMQSGPVGMTPCIDFAPYSWARTAANAATAYLSVGDYSQALDLTQGVSAVVDNSNSDWSRSLVHLDEANALTLGRHADMEHAAALGIQALAASANKPIVSVSSRAGELAAGLHLRGGHRTARDFSETLQEWKQRARRLST